jgi:hypothetical protein
MSHNIPYRGVFTIPSTPFREDGDIDWSDFRRVLDFCVNCGAHGIVWPVNASSFAVLTDEERLHGMEVVVEQVAGQMPGCHITDVVVRLWNALEAGDLTEAKHPYGERNFLRLSEEGWERRVAHPKRSD